MRRIILFTGGVETLGFFSIELAIAFRELSYETYLYDLDEEQRCYHELISFCEGSQTVLVTFNFIGLSGEPVFLLDNGLFWDVWNIPCINIVVDHPFYYHKNLRLIPQQYQQICIDRFHEGYMKRFFPHVKMASFLPLGGTSLFPNPIKPSLTERPIDLVFTGNYTPPARFDKFITRNGEEYTAFYHSIIDYLIENPHVPMELAFETFLRNEMGELSENDLLNCMENMIFIDLYVRFYFRGLVVRTLVDSGLNVHVFGKGWNLLECSHPEHLIDGDAVDSETCLKMMQQAKISLNVMPWFKDGAHDRIFNSMLNGAMCLSDGSIYLENEFQDGETIKFYSLLEIPQLPDMIKELLAHPASIQKIANAGYQKALKFHTWKERADQIDKVIR